MIISIQRVVLVVVVVVVGVAAEARGSGYCLSWRVGVEANNVRGWWTTPAQCWRHIKYYMVGGQYSKDTALVVDQIYQYLATIPLPNDNDAWVLDVDDTCLSNLVYYSSKKFGREPYDPVGFRRWALTGGSKANPWVLGLFNKLLQVGFKVVLLTGRDEETLGEATKLNLVNQGFFGYHRLILRSKEYRGESAVEFKSQIRKQLEEEGYRIWGNVGDQWSDLQGDYVGNRTFKLPNPMYFVP